MDAVTRRETMGTKLSCDCWCGCVSTYEPKRARPGEPYACLACRQGNHLKPAAGGFPRP